MEIVKILLLTVLPAVVLGCIAGVMIGKYQIKKAAHQLRPLLSIRQRIAYSASIAVGVVCVLLGIFLPAPSSTGDIGMSENGFTDNGVMMFDGKGEYHIDDAMPVIGGETEEAEGGDFSINADDETDSPEDGEAVDSDSVEDDNAEGEEAQAGKPAPSAGSGGAVAIIPRAAPSVRSDRVVIMR